MPQYLFLLYDDESRWVDATPEDTAAEMAEHGAFAEAVGASEGAQILGGAALQSTESTSVPRR